MEINVVSVFPEFFSAPLSVGVIGRALRQQLAEVKLINPRKFGKGATRRVDDAPFGGGPGMIMTIEPLAKTLSGLADTHKVLLSATGTLLTQVQLQAWSELDRLTLVCGRYEGVDQRVADNLVDQEISLGDYVLPGGETAALAIIEGVVRLLPGALGNPDSTHTESFAAGYELEEPQYTRPAEFRGWRVPEVLLSGNHQQISDWRKEQRRIRTQNRRSQSSIPTPTETELAGNEAVGDGP